MTELMNKTLSQIVTENYQAARVFEKYGLDFCCKGRRPLTDACREKSLPVDHVVKELSDVLDTVDTEREFNQMSLTELAEYIVRIHHSYVRQSMPQIMMYVLKVSEKHGTRYPFMHKVYELFAELSEEMTQHMAKEEKILFPRIKLMELNANPRNANAYISGPVEVMEHEHDHAGTTMEKIRLLTGNYRAPEDACTTFRLALASLQAFEADLHHHVHLENNILFPKALALYAGKYN
jgi:regulator of cell morphogenesis and NO signaling